MASIVIVHGVGQQLVRENTLHSRLFPALCDGLAFKSVRIEPADVAFASYGYIFRPSDEYLGIDEYFDASDVSDDYSLALLSAWWQRAAALDEAVVPPDAETLGRSPRWAQNALYALNRSPFFSGLAEHALIGDLRQVKRYFSDEKIRSQIQWALSRAVDRDTRVLVGHSLGSVVAYEALCAHPEWPVHTFVTLGSPLGMRHLVYDRLRPPPRPDDGSLRGVWPGGNRTWTNIADSGDVVAVVEDLRPFFGTSITQVRVHNGAHAHDMASYLTASATGAAIAAGL
jgi:pimeloyl-ACP methyl ester carboxylesterase